MAGQKELMLSFAVLFCILPCMCFAFGGSFPPPITRSLRTTFVCGNYSACTPSDNASFPNLIHVRAAGPNDTLHYLIGTIGVPTLLVARTSANATVHINQDHLMTGNYSQLGNDTITFSSEPFYVYSVLFTTVYEYDDRNDTADLGKMSNESQYWRFHRLSGLQWLPSVDISDPAEHIIFLNVTSKKAMHNNTDPFFFQENGTFSLKFQFKTSEDRNENLPHLEFNANNTQVALVLDHLEPAFNNSRFALELSLISSDSAAREMNLTKARSIDDEHTPGVFEMVDWTTRLNESSELQSTGGYMQWKPICYKTIARSIHDVTKQFYYDLEDLSNDTLAQYGARVSLAFAYFGADLMENRLSMSTTNVSFGLSKDKFYKDSSYMIWTFAIGYGTPPADTVSLMIKLVITVGLGIPVVFIIVGGIVVCVKKCKARREAAGADMTSSYQAID